MDVFAKRLNESLKDRGLSIADFAEKIEMAQRTVYQYCQGSRSPALEVFLKICIALDESADYLIGIKND